MLKYKEFKKIYKDSSYKKYLFNHIFYKIKRICRIPYCIFMCLKYPFLYPRNRFTDLHYNNRKIIDYYNNVREQYMRVVSNNDVDELIKNKNILWYFSLSKIKTDNSISFVYWKTWWSLPLADILKFFHNTILQIIFCIPTYIEWDKVDEGWNKAFGKQYLKDLRKQLKKDKMLYSWRITDIKEKWGRLNLYCNKASDELYAIINKYEKLSWDYCIKCGNKADYVSTGWIAPYCKNCAEKEDNKLYYTKKEYEEEGKVY